MAPQIANMAFYTHDYVSINPENTSDTMDSDSSTYSPIYFISQKKSQIQW